MTRLARIGIASGVAAALAAFLGLYRPWHSRWGATDEEVRREMPGDEVIREPTFAPTRAITVDAPPEKVWPWIVQMGFGRAGWYTYDLLDNLGRRSAQEIMPSLQEVRVGDLVPLGPGGAGLRVKDLQQGRWLLWWDGVGYTTWLWSLQPTDAGGTRLVTRIRIRYRWPHPTLLFNLLLIEPWDFPMMRKCMLGIKRRAESLHARQVVTSPELRRARGTGAGRLALLLAVPGDAPAEEYCPDHHDQSEDDASMTTPKRIRGAT